MYTKNGAPFVVLDDFSIDISKNEFVTVVGTSGCGKSTLLAMVGGLVEASEGQVLIDGQTLSTGRDATGALFSSRQPV